MLSSSLNVRNIFNKLSSTKGNQVRKPVMFPLKTLPPLKKPVREPVREKSRLSFQQDVLFSKLILTSFFQILNITVSSSRVTPRRGPVNIIFAVKSTQGFLNGSEVSELLRNLSVVEFSFYLGYPVLQIAEREYGPLGRAGEVMVGILVEELFLKFF